MSEKGVKLNPGKVKAIVELPAPKNVSEMHQLFGTIDYLGKFLPNLSDVKNPISELLVIVPGLVSPAMEAFEKVRAIVTTFVYQPSMM